MHVVCRSMIAISSQIKDLVQLLSSQTWQSTSQKELRECHGDECLRKLMTDGVMADLWTFVQC
jgi:hypothetical protein